MQQFLTHVPARRGDAAWDNRLRVAPVSSESWELNFGPDYTPQQMMNMGVFGDAYWAGPEGEERRALLLPHMPIAQPVYENIRGRQCYVVNHFKVPASLYRDQWLDSDFIFREDPLGWFEWYCWWSLGRKMPGYDDHQINRWRNFRTRMLGTYRRARTPGAAQSLLHWGVSVEAE